MYTEKILERFKNPKFSGEIKDADSVGEEGNAKCGDIMRVYINVEDNIIKDIKFKTYGCVAAIASTDFLCELAKGKTLTAAKKLTKMHNLKKIPFSGISVKRADSIRYQILKMNPITFNFVFVFPYLSLKIIFNFLCKFIRI